MKREVFIFYKILSIALHPERKHMMTNAQKKEVISFLPSFLSLAQKHNVTALFYEALFLCDIALPTTMHTTLQMKVLRDCCHSYDMLFFNKKIIALLQEQNISYYVLKGLSLLLDYPKWECRPFSDVDILITNQEDYRHAKDIFLANGFSLTKESADHHEELLYHFQDKTYILELHNKVINSYDDAKLDKAIANFFKPIHPDKKEFPIAALTFSMLPPEQNLIYLLLHMQQHFIHLGFGIRLLCDWTVYLKHHAHEINFSDCIVPLQKLHLTTFFGVMTEICIRYLGLSRELLEKNNCPFLSVNISQSLLDAVLEDIHTAGEFGNNNKYKIMITQKSSFFSSFQEGHRQMRTYFPRLSHCFLFWPVLWGITLWRFFYNNHHLRSIDTKTLLENTRQRQKLFKALHLGRR